MRDLEERLNVWCLLGHECSDDRRSGFGRRLVTYWEVDKFDILIMLVPIETEISTWSDNTLLEQIRQWLTSKYCCLLSNSNKHSFGWSIIRIIDVAVEVWFGQGLP